MSEQRHLSLSKKKLFWIQKLYFNSIKHYKNIFWKQNLQLLLNILFKAWLLDIIIKATPHKLYNVSIRLKKKKKAPLTPPQLPSSLNLSLCVACKPPQLPNPPAYNIPIAFQISLENHIFPHIYILMYSHSVACEIAIGQTVLNGAVLAVRCHRCSEQGDINVGSSS